MPCSEHQGEVYVLENNGATNVPPPPPSYAATGGHRNLLIVVVAFVAVALVVGSVLAVTLLSAPAGQGAWRFKGAYANYAGSTSVMGYGFNFSVRFEVLDFNSTHAYILTSSRMGSSLGETVENENATWVELSGFGFMNAFSESNMTNSYEAKVVVAGMGTRDCMVYEYATDGPTMTVYVDKALDWPVKMAMTMNEGSVSLSLDIILTDTNIPGLM
jgi:hypothetical protein